MATTYEPLATTTLGSAARSITFSSIPGTYTDLVVVIRSLASAEAYFATTFNSDTGTNYSSTYLFGNGTSAFSSRQSNAGSIAGSRSDTNAVFILNIMNYANTTTYKTTISRTSNSAQVAMTTVGLWRSTSAITSVTVSGQDSDWSSGTMATLYGIKAA